MRVKVKMKGEEGAKASGESGEGRGERERGRRVEREGREEGDGRKRERRQRERARHTIHENDIPLTDALLAQHAGKGLDLCQQLPVREALLGPGYGAVVEEGRLAAAAGPGRDGRGSCSTSISRRRGTTPSGRVG